MGLLDSLTPDNYRNYVLPAMGVIEAIATRGRSPGTTAAAQGEMIRHNQEDDIKRQQFAQQTQAAQQEAAARALQMRLGTVQLSNEEKDSIEKERKTAAIAALKGRLGVKPEEQAYYDAFPEKYGDQLKPESNVYIPGMNGIFVAPKTGAPIATKLTDGAGAAVMPPPRPSDKSLAEIEAEARARAAGSAAGNPKADDPKQNQSAAAGFGKRAILAESELLDLSGKGFDPAANMGILANLLPNSAQSGERQRYSNAKTNFKTAVLRKESGASISPSEDDGAERLYFAQPGDKPETLVQKSRARAAAIASLKAEAGHAWDGVANVAGPDPSGMVWRKSKDGKEYEFDAATKKPTGNSR